MASRTVVLAGVGAVVLAGAAYWFLYMDDAPPAPAAKPVAVGPKSDAAKPAASPGSDASKPPAAAPPSPAAPAGAASPGEDQLAAMDREIKATQARVGELEKTMADLRNQISMKDKEIAAAESK